MVSELAADVYAPRARTWDEQCEPLPPAERRRLGELGLLGMTLSEEVGGSGRPLVDALVALEELAKANPIAAWPVFEACTGPARVIDILGTAEQRARLLPPVVTGEQTIAVAISEAEAGSAATDLCTRARIEGDVVVVNGAKRWCSGAGHAEQYLVYVRISDDHGAAGIGAVVVDKGAPGLTFGPQESLMGFHGIGSADMFFDDVQVPLSNLVVGAGGFSELFRVFSIERLGNATMALAIGQAALDRSVAHIRTRQQFGRPIAEFQLVQGAIADMVTQVSAARLLIRNAAEKAGRGAPSALDASVAKYSANLMAKSVSDLAIQLHGGYGFSAEYEVERMHRDSHGWALAGGTLNMQRVRIASEYLGRRFSQRVS